MNTKRTVRFGLLVTAAVVVALSFVLANCGGGGGGGFVAGIREISSWAFVDGNTANGINKDGSKPVWAAQLTEFNGKLYATWDESNGTAYQIRIAVYNGNDASPSWLFVDGNGTNGINKDAAQNAGASQLTAFNGKLYATWNEKNGAPRQIRVAVYNGDDSTPGWTFVDGNGASGINKDTTRDAVIAQLTACSGKLYATWLESNGTANQVRVAVYNGNDASPSWSFVDGNGTTGISKDTTQYVDVPQLTAFSGKLYATWLEANGTTDEIRVAVYNGNDASPSWSFIDGGGANGINNDPAHFASSPQLTVFKGKLYATWQEDNGIANQVRVAVYNGNDASPSWSFVDGNGTTGINKDKTRYGIKPELTAFNGKLYATWLEDNGTANQARVAVYSGNDASPNWSFVDGGNANGLNKDATKFADYPQLTVFNSKLYGIWTEDNGTANQVRVAVGR